MTRKFCVSCGKAEKELISGLCSECFNREKVKVSVDRKVKGMVCRNCFSIYYKRWNSFSGSLDEAAVEAAFVATENNIYVENIEEPTTGIEALEVISTSPRDYLVTLNIRVKDEKQNIERSLDVKVPVKLSICPTCQRSVSRYYEAIVQLRGLEKKSPDEKEKIRAAMEKAILSQNDLNTFISELKKIRGGYDFYVGSAKAARKSVNILRVKYGGFLKESSKLFGMGKNGKELYRITYLLRLPEFSLGNIIEDMGKLYQITGLKGNLVSLFDLKERRSSGTSLAKIEKNKIVAEKKGYIKAIITEVRNDEVQLLDMQEYKTFYLHLNIALKIGNEVNTIKLNDTYYLLKTEEEGKHGH
ncbi:NMD3 family protein [archaeon]|nr:NMD3 family protein [archaeon]